MAKTTNPLFSEKASGDLGKVIQFVCGHFVRKKPGGIQPSAESQKAQMLKFSQGAALWSETLTPAIKKNWTLFLVRIKLQDQCITESITISGYDIWQMYFLKFGIDGWVNYPNPPT